MTDDTNDTDDDGRTETEIAGHNRDVSEIPEAELGVEYDIATDHFIDVSDALNTVKRMYVDLDGAAEQPFRQDTRATLRNAQDQVRHASDLLEAEREAVDSRREKLRDRLDEVRNDTDDQSEESD